MSSGGPRSSLWKSSDGGDRWTDISRAPGLAARRARAHRRGSLTGRRPPRVCGGRAEDGALFRSDDAGATWQRCSEQAGLRGRPWYYMHVFADPADVDTVWVADYSLWKSSDGGMTFVEVATPHGDNHDLWIDPANPRRMIEGNDGGALRVVQRRTVVVHDLQPADRAVLSRVCRRPAPLPDLRLPAGQLGDQLTRASRTGARSRRSSGSSPAAVRVATSR